MIAQEAPEEQLAEVFVNRKYELSIVEEKIDLIRVGSSVFQAAVNYFGVIGIGKSWLVNELYRRARGKGVPCGRIDFLVDKYRPPQKGRIALLEDLVADLSGQVELKPVDFKREADKFWRLWRQQRKAGSLEGDKEKERQEEQIESATKALVEYVQKVLDYMDRMPVVLFFDTAEDAEQTVFDWVEDEIISPLLQTDKVIFVVAGRSVQRWKRFEVRRRIQQVRLEPFNGKMTAEQIKKYDELADNIIHLTFGHPYANKKVAESLYKIEVEEEKAVDTLTFGQYRKQLVRELVETLIDPVIMKDVPNEIGQAYRVMAIFRQFDVNILRSVLSDFVPDLFEGRSGAYYLSVVGRMVETTLVEWNSARKGYALDDTVRRMLALDMQLSQPETFKAISEKATDLYQDWIKRVPENRSGYIIEKLYHEAAVRSVEEEDKEEIQHDLCEELEDYLRQYYADKEEKVPPGLTSLREDLDKDEELKEHLSEDEQDCLVGVVDDFVQEVHSGSGL